MINNDNEDEYQLADPDGVMFSPCEQLESKKATKPPEQSATSHDFKKIIRHGLIVIGVIFVLMFLYKVIGTFLTNKKSSSSQVSIMPIEAKVNKQQPIKSAPLPIFETQAPKENASKQLTTLEEQQQTIGNQVVSVNTQLGTVNSTLLEMTKKIEALDQMVVSLNNKIDSQSREVMALQAQKAPVVSKPKPIKHKPVSQAQKTKYFLQAVIPGRAWLIAENGSTLTVRDGSLIAGYGIVRLIDPNQGRVITSSGQVIQFSQTDS